MVNGYINLALDLGLVGLTLYLLALGQLSLRSFRLFMQGQEGYRRWPLAYMIFVLLYPCTEGGIFGGNNLLWILFCGLAFSMTFELRQREQQDEDAIPRQMAA